VLALNVVRLAFAVAAIVAVTYQFAATAESGFQEANFFSFFTIQSNLLAVATLCLLAIVRRNERTVLFDAMRSGVVLYMAITGIVFALLLSGLQEELQTTNPWVDFVVHKLMPVVLVVDWLVDPPRHRLRRWTAAAWLSFPCTRSHGALRSTGIRIRSWTSTSWATAASSGALRCSWSDSRSRPWRCSCSAIGLPDATLLPPPRG